MKKSIVLLLSMTFSLIVSCQDKDFYKRTNHYGGIYTTQITFPDSSKMTSANIGSTEWSAITGKPAIFPSSWEIVANKPLTFPPDAHNHDALYKPIGWMPTWDNVTGKPTAFPSTWNLVAGKPTFALVATTGLFNDLLSKPTTIAGYGITNAMTTSHPANAITSTNITNWNTAFGWGNHSGLYRPITWVPAWADVTGKPTTFTPTAHTHDYNTDIINKPPQQDLMQAIAGLDYLPIPSKTTAQINALVMPTGASAIVKDATLNVYKVYKDGIWSIVITGN